jgi:hypothetical protein
MPTSILSLQRRPAAMGEHPPDAMARPTIPWPRPPRARRQPLKTWRHEEAKAWPRQPLKTCPHGTARPAKA